MVTSFDTMNTFKKMTLKEIAKRCYAGTISRDDADDIARTLIPYSAPRVRCCIYKEREVIRERAYLAMGYTPSGEEPKSGQYVYVLEAACDDCNIHKVRITDNCQKCLFKACVNACKFNAIYEGDSKMHIDYKKCMACTMCAKSCPYGSVLVSDRPCHKSCPTGALLYQEGDIAKIDYQDCISCGQCQASCPFGAISEISFMKDVIKSINDKKKVVALVAPAILGQWGKASLKQIYSALYKIGFSYIIEVAVGADVTTANEAKEALKAKREGKKITTSCCPAFVSYIKKKFPKVYQENTSDVLSPMAITGRIAKKIYGEDCISVFIGPCVAKKAEKDLLHNIDNVDYVMTFEEITAMMEAKDINPIDLPEEDNDVLKGSYSGRNFCNVTGVATSLNSYLAEMGEDSRLTLKSANGKDLVIQCLKYLSKGKQNEDVLEGMMCLNGCIGGIDSNVSNPLLIKSFASKANEETKNKKIEENNSVFQVGSRYIKE